MYSDILVVLASEVEVLDLVGGLKKAKVVCLSTLWVEGESAAVICRHLKERVCWKFDIASPKYCLNLLILC